MIQSITEDKEGNLWIGTENGLNKFERNKEKFIRLQNLASDSSSLGYNRIMPIYIDKNGIIWIGNFGGGFNKFDPELKTFTSFINGPSYLFNYIWSIFEDGEGNFWLGTHGGLVKFDRNNSTFKNYTSSFINKFNPNNNRVLYILEDEENYLWLATESAGVQKFDIKK